MKEQFTPGPWKFGHLGSDALWIGPDYDQMPVAHVDHDMEYARDNSRANARLIASAPDLLAALATTVGRVEDAANWHHNAQHWHEEDAPDGSGLTLWEWVFAPAHDAIAKARGEHA